MPRWLNTMLLENGSSCDAVFRGKVVRNNRRLPSRSRKAGQTTREGNSLRALRGRKPKKSWKADAKLVWCR